MASELHSGRKTKKVQLYPAPQARSFQSQMYRTASPQRVQCSSSRNFWPHLESRAGLSSSPYPLLAHSTGSLTPVTTAYFTPAAWDQLGWALLGARCIELCPGLGQNNTGERGLGALSHWWGSQEILRVLGEDEAYSQTCLFVHPTIWTVNQSHPQPANRCSHSYAARFGCPLHSSAPFPEGARKTRAGEEAWARAAQPTGTSWRRPQH